MPTYFTVAQELNAPLEILVGPEEDLVAFLEENVKYLTNLTSLNFLATSSHRSLRLGVANNIFVTSEILTDLLASTSLNDLQMRQSIANNLMTSTEDLAKLLEESPFASILEALALNPSTPSGTITEIYEKHLTPEVEFALALNPSTPDKIILNLQNSNLAALSLLREFTSL